MKNKQNHLALVVLGDVGHSPRMQNHAVEIANNTDFHVHLVGYIESVPCQEVINSHYITLHEAQSRTVTRMRRWPPVLYPLYAMLRFAIQFFYLLYTFFFRVPACRYYVVQNPPTLPILPLLALVSFLRGGRLIIDFHNFGYTLMTVNRRPPYIVAIARFMEQKFARMSYRNFCVSEAMQKQLAGWGVRAEVLRDRANINRFKQFQEEEYSSVLTKYGLKKQGLLLISSTSWTPDEDFGILLAALEQYERNATQQSRCITCLITGKGPMKDRYMAEVRSKSAYWRKIKIMSLWLDTEDYPVVMAAADLGVCLHYSSSGVDLPMKVVDMFGAGVPVLAVEYPTIRELVIHQQNGMLFNNSNDLCELLQKFTADSSRIKALRKGVHKWRSVSFHDQWESHFKTLQ